jgi:hypothetical protein
LPMGSRCGLAYRGQLPLVGMLDEQRLRNANQECRLRGLRMNNDYGSDYGLEAKTDGFQAPVGTRSESAPGRPCAAGTKIGASNTVERVGR